jgi:cation transport ATPase
MCSEQPRYSAGRFDEVALDSLMPGDGLLIRLGDVVPVDGIIALALAMLDPSSLTKETFVVRLA